MFTPSLNVAPARIRGLAMLFLGTVTIAAQPFATLTILEADSGRVRVEWNGSGELYQLQSALALANGSPSAWRDVVSAPIWSEGRYRLDLDAAAGAQYFRLIMVPQPPPGQAPDPTVVAPPLPANGLADFGSAMEFLYAGPNPVQLGVAPGAIDRVRLAVMHGVVRLRGGAPLAGVRVSVAGAPEYGFTYTREDGRYDLAANAAEFNLDYRLAGYLPAQRHVRAGVQDFTTAADVTLVPMDPVATPLAFGPGTPLQVATSSTNVDAAGARSATILVPSGTTAWLRFADGTRRETGGLTLRATEFTVGADGPSAMPAALPPTSGYTYCAEFGADEVPVAGASGVEFSQPVPVYVDNFLNLPVGTLVPIGYYDRNATTWVAARNGIVLKILGREGGLAQLDLHGQGLAENSATLESLGITPDERLELASRYPVGKTLWRAPIPHFSIWDFNYGLWQPDPQKPNRPGDKPKGDACDTCPDRFGTLNFSTRVFRERVPIAGLTFELHYSSARVPGYRVDNVITVPVTYEPPPSGCGPAAQGGRCLNPPTPDPVGIRVETEVMGNRQTTNLPIAAQTATVSWDGRDAYGRLAGGTRKANITVAYEFPSLDYLGTCCGPELLGAYPALFGSYGGQTTFIGHYGGRVAIGANYDFLMTYPDHRQLGLGGWSLTPVHRYDAVGGLLYYGDGRIRRVPEGATFGGGLMASVTQIALAAGAPDRSVVFFGSTSGGGNRLFRRKPGGAYDFISAHASEAGVVRTAIAGYAAADGLPAAQVAVEDVYALTTGPDGSIYVGNDDAILRLLPSGTWQLVIGGATGPAVFPPDGSLARGTARAGFPGGRAMAVGPDGTLYFASFWGADQNLIRKVVGDGRIYTVYGQGGALKPGESWRDFLGGSAHDARNGGAGHFVSLAAGTDGTLYAAPGFSGGNAGAFKITPDGVIRPFLNSTPRSFAGGYDPADGAAASAVLADEGKLGTEIESGGFQVNQLLALADGSVAVVAYEMVWRVNPNGRLERLAGRVATPAYSAPYEPADNADPLNTFLDTPGMLAATPDGRLLLARGGRQPMLYTFGTPQQTQSPGDILNQRIVPSDTGDELFVFDANGRHRQTLDSLTGALRWSFGYDDRQRLVSLTNAVGQVTRVEHDAAGQPTAIVAPAGERTTLTVDGSGFLSRIVNPVGEAVSLTNSPGGLLLAVQGPLKGTFLVDYDELGQGRSVTDPQGGGYVLTLLDDGLIGSRGYQVELGVTNSLGESTLRQLVLQPDGATYVNQFAGSNFVRSALYQPSGAASGVEGDGSTTSVEVGPDPRFGRTAVVERQRLFTLPVQPALGLPKLEYRAATTRAATLTDPENPLSLVDLTETQTVNGDAYAVRYTASNQTATVTSPAGRAFQLVVDSLRRPIRIESPGRPTVAYVYNADGRLVAREESSASGRRRATFAYNALGQGTLVTDPAGRTNTFEYDGAGRLQRVGLPDGRSVGLTFDAAFRLTSLTPPGRPAHHFEYDGSGNLTRYVPPAVGGDDSVRLERDGEGRVAAIDFPDGRQLSYTRGAQGRLEQVTASGGPTLTLRYGAEPGTLGTDPLLKEVLSSAGEHLAFGYQGPFLARVSWSGAVQGQIAVTLNPNLDPASRTIGGTTIAFAYDRDRLLTQAGELNLTRNPDSGEIETTTLRGVTDERRRDDRGRLTHYEARFGGATVYAIDLTYDLLDRIATRTESVQGVTHTRAFAYDVAGRLERVTTDGVVSAVYSYDANGNRLSHNGRTATYDAQDRLLSYADAGSPNDSMSFTWSRNGTLDAYTCCEGAERHFQYDLRGALTGYQVAGANLAIDYVLDPAGNRVGKKVNGTLRRGWLWDGLAPIAEVDATSTVTAQFIHAADGMTPSVILRGGQVYRVISDERDSVRLVIDASTGAVAQELDYDEFGKVLKDTAPEFQPFGFAGGLYDPDTGLVRFGLRDYLPDTGQWLARDPLGFAGGSLSLYAYLGNDPVNGIDPSGAGAYPPGIQSPLRPSAPPGFPMETTAPGLNDLNSVANVTVGGNQNQNEAPRWLATTGKVMFFGGAAVVAASEAPAVVAYLAATSTTYGEAATLANGARFLYAGFRLANTGVAIAANTANAAGTFDAHHATDAPTSLGQTFAPGPVGDAIDSANGKVKLPEAGPAWLRKAGAVGKKISQAGKKICNATK